MRVYDLSTHSTGGTSVIVVGALLAITIAMIAAAVLGICLYLFESYAEVMGQRLELWLPTPLKTHLQHLLWPQENLQFKRWLTLQFVSGISILLVFALGLWRVALAMAFGWFLHWGLLYQKQRRYRRMALAELPTTLDLLAMLLQSGSSLTAAIAAIAARPDGPLVLEFRYAHQGLQAGHTTASVLTDLASRLPLPEIKIVVATMLHAVKHGAVLAETLRFQAAQRRQEVLLRMERQAQEAPIKLLFPLLTCFFPVSFMLLIGPMLLRFSME